MIDETLAFLVRAFEIVGEFEEAFQKPRLLVEPVVGQDRLVGTRAAPSTAKGGRADQQISPCRHG